MSDEPRANFIAGAFGPAARGARTGGREPGASWPQSDVTDVAGAARAAESAGAAWRGLSAARRGELVTDLSRALERDELLPVRLGERFRVEPQELAPHFAGLEGEVRALLQRPPAPAAGVAWCAPDWRELVRAPLSDLARELVAGRTAVLLSDQRLPDPCERIALAARAAGLPAGVLGVLHGATRELVGLALSAPAPGEGRTLVASGLVERMVELRRLCEGHGMADARLRALRCGVFEVDIGRGDAGEVDAASELEATARACVERAFGRGTTLTGQLPGALGRIFCPARCFARFSELFLSELEASAAWRAPAPQLDDEALARARAACELGLDEGATCIAGGDLDATGERFLPALFTNVEPFMASAKRQDPLPVLCLLRAP